MEGGAMEGVAIEPFLKQVTLLLTMGVEFAAALVVAGAVLQASVSAIRLAVQIVLRRAESQSPSERIRIRLGQWLSVALEFELAADILRTAVAPTWNEIGKLGAIVVIRTVLNWFLQRDIDQARKREEQR